MDRKNQTARSADGLELAPSETKRATLNRAIRRRHGDRNPLPEEHGHQRIPTPAYGGMRRSSGGRTGSPAWFREMQARLRLNRALQKIKVPALAVDPELAPVRRQLMAISGQYQTVFALCKADRAELLAIEGVGAAGLARIEAYLRAREVAPRWGASNG